MIMTERAQFTPNVNMRINYNYNEPYFERYKVGFVYQGGPYYPFTLIKLQLVAMSLALFMLR